MCTHAYTYLPTIFCPVKNPQNLAVVPLLNTCAVKAHSMVNHGGGSIIKFNC